MRVLVVEDEPRLAEGLRRGLVAEGFAVDVVHDGVDGLWMAREENYDVILLDIMLPGMNGYKVCQALREDKIWTPILMLTAKDGTWDEIEALDTGADDSVTKPFSFQLLLARVRALLRRGATERPVVLQAGDLSLDPSSKSVCRGGQDLALTAREFTVLEYLMRNKGAVMSKRDILDHVWNYDFEGDPNIVEVYVRRLRTKVDHPFGRCAVETVRGSGYRLASHGG